MQVEAIYNAGRLEFVQPIKLKSVPVRLMVTVPDDAIQNPADNSELLLPEEKSEIWAELEKYRAILSAPLLSEKDLPALSSKHQERIQAMNLRAEYRTQQGRPD